MPYDRFNMNKRLAVTLVSAAVLLVGAAGASSNNQSSKLNTTQDSINTSTAEDTSKKTIPTCDGTAVTVACTADGIKYKTYIYHPAVAEKTHTETVTTYREEINGYCTLCGDGSYSPSCATGSGACSHHDGVAQWNAPVVRNVPVYTTNTIVDAPAVEEFYEKILE